MKTKKLLAMGLTAIMLVCSAAGCGNTEGKGAGQTAAPAESSEKGSDAAGATVADSAGTTEGTDTSGADNAGASAGAVDKSASSTGAAAYNVDWEDTAEINVVLIAPGAVPPGLQEVEDAINEITEAEIDTHVNLEMLEMGNYIQQLSLKLSSSEQVDLVMSFPGGSVTFNAMQTQGQLMDITQLLAEYGQPVLDTVGQYIKATTINGKIYGVPVYRNYSSSIYAVMRTDVLEDLGLEEQAQNIKCLKDLEAILEAVKTSEKWGYLAGLSPAAGNGTIAFNGGAILGIDSAQHLLFDTLGASDLIMVDPTGQDTTVKLTPATPEYKELYEYVHEWYEKGYIYMDSATATDTGIDLVKADKGLGMLMNGELGMEASTAQMCQMPMTCVPLVTLPISTRTCTGFTWVVPNSAKYPEAAVTFLSMMYTSHEINDLLVWGIEGRDYVLKDGFAQYPDGITDVPYHSADIITGNQFIVTPWAGQSADIREQSMKVLKDAPISAYLGFTCNTDSISNALSAVNNVVAEYAAQINSGVAEPGVLDDYLKKLESSDVQKVVDEYQNQLNAWLEQNK